MMSLGRFLPFLGATMVLGRGLSSDRRLRFNPFCEQLQLCNLWPGYAAINTSQVPNSNNTVRSCVNAFGAIRVVDDGQTCASNTEKLVNLNAGPVASPTPSVIGSSVKISGSNTVSSAGLGQPFSVKQPYLSVNFIICLLGIYPTSARRRADEVDQNEMPSDEQNHRSTVSAVEAFIGEIRMFAGNFAPDGWAFCDGSLLSISQNPALFSILGTTYGGNGVNNFGLPDLRGRVPISFGQGSGLSSVNLGEKSGSESATATVATMPAHTHTINTVTGTLTLN